jgi:hypothetical protein
MSKVSISGMTDIFQTVIRPKQRVRLREGISGLPLTKPEAAMAQKYIRDIKQEEDIRTVKHEATF